MCRCYVTLQDQFTLLEEEIVYELELQKNQSIYFFTAENELIPHGNKIFFSYIYLIKDSTIEQIHEKIKQKDEVSLLVFYAEFPSIRSKKEQANIPKETKQEENKTETINIPQEEEKENKPMTYKEQFSFEKRCADYNKAKLAKKDFFPFIVEKHADSTLSSLPKFKYIYKYL